jgi:thiamine transport system substrate-binding protein
MKQPVLKAISLFVLAAVLAACAPGDSGAPAEITVMTHSSFDVSDTVIQEFQEDYDVKVTFLDAGDSGTALNKAILAVDAPLADVFYGVDNTFLSRALEADIFEPYQSPELENIPDEFRLDPESRALPVDYGDVCINYDKRYFAEHNLAVPQSLEELTEPEYEGLLVVENPATSSPGLAFLLATVQHFGDEQYIRFWKDLRANGLVVADSWDTAYYTHFSGSSGNGPQPMVVSYASSPAAEVIYADPPVTDAPTASILAPDTCARQIEFVGILKGTHNRRAAEKFVDFMLSRKFQRDMPLKMFVYPVNPDAPLPEPFTRYAQVPEQPVRMSPDNIAANRERWIDEWTQAVLR